jgi:hypothetical protein
VPGLRVRDAGAGEVELQAEVLQECRGLFFCRLSGVVLVRCGWINGLIDRRTDLLLQVLHVAEALQRQPQQGRAVARGGAGLLRLGGL